MKRSSNAHRLQIALLVVLSLMLVWGAAVYELYRSQQTYLHDAEVRTAVQAHVFSEYSHSTFKRINEVIIDLRTRWTGDWQAFAAMVQRTQENIDDFTFQVAVIDKDGLLAFSNLAVPTDRTDLSQREHFRVHKEAANADHLFISRPLKGKVSGKWSIQITRPIFKSGQFDGVMVVSLSPEKFAGFAEKLGLKGASVMTVVRNSGEIMARYPVVESSLGQVIKDRPFLQPDAPVSGNFHQVSSVDAKDRIFGYHRSPEYGITFVVGEAVSDVLAPYDDHFQKVVGAALAISVLALVFFLMLFRSLVELEEVRQQLVAIFALSPDGFVSFDDKRQVKYASPTFMRMTGLDEAAIAGLDEAAFSACLARLCLDTACFPGVAALRATYRSGVADASKHRHLIEIANVGKRVLEVGIRLSEAKTVSQILYFRDVTHETEVDRMKSEFLSTAAHELRTPMASIFGFSELLLAQEFPEEERREMLDIIYRQSSLMVSIINELLDLVRIEERRGKDFELARIEAGELVSAASADFKPPAGRAAPQIVRHGHAHWLQADRNKLTQAIGNVLSNAYKYSPDGGAVDIELVDASEGNQPGRIGIRITDHGIGMTPEQTARVFERFYRADFSGSIPGTGLGMSIVKEIVELHGGSVDFESGAGVGTTVTLWLPAA